MAGAGPSGLRGVVHLAPLDRRHVVARRLLQGSPLPAELLPVVVLRAGAVGTSEDARPGLRVEDVVNGGRRAIVKVRRCRPHALQRRRLVAAMTLRRLLLAEPAAVERLLRV